MARPKEFDPDVALGRAIGVFRAKSYAAVSTGELCAGMGIARQSLYDTFGDKATLYRTALARYREANDEQLTAAVGCESALDGLRAVFDSVATASLEDRRAGCMMVNAIGELAAHDPDVASVARDNQRHLLGVFADAVRAGQRSGEIARSIDADEAAGRLVTTFYGLRVMAKADPRSPLVAASARHATDFLLP